ncbi:olfactory receptor-like protein OLF1 [Bufo bufo]|uniref:olfactory receptor-like protein OLF1 n=1 Tax=Bufo bufo TaxID=8384 RepID=UPI001ABE13C9|nr:olfactory receptor-like protein OLF1 [Bufo bufo]
MGNQTAPMQFVLTGFSKDPDIQIFSFVLFLIIYLIGSLGNLLIFFIIWHVTYLQTPMYFFIKHLAFLDMCFISTIVPKLLVSSISECVTISFGGCVIQLFIFLAMAAAESTLLAAMSYDRYVAICNPLHYIYIMKREVCIQLASTSWIIGSVYSTTHTVNTFRLNFCRSNIIDHFFCDLPPLLKIACSDIRLNQRMIFVIGAILILPFFPLTVVSYVFIIRTIVRIPSATGRRKTFSTCASHLITVSFYLTGISVYLRPNFTSTALHQGKISAVFYTILVPMVNPIVYSLRNKELKQAIKKIITGGKPIGKTKESCN